MSSILPTSGLPFGTASDPFDADRAYRHTQELCYPRRVGTWGERRTAGRVARYFESLGLACRRERFSVSHFPAEIGNRLAFIGCTVLLMLGAYVSPAWPIVAALCWGLAALLVNAPWRFQPLLPRWLPPLTSSANVMATLPEPAASPARVVFLAHYDTKSQLLPTGVRAALVTLTTWLSGLLALLGLGSALGFPVFLHTISPWWLAGIICLFLAGLVLNRTGNRSPGALDNGSAVGTLLELARCWRPQPGVPVDAVWVATGSEEVALDGARHLLRTQNDWWHDKPTLVVNLESVGTGSHVYLAGEAGAVGLAQDVADELAIRHAELHILGAGMDHEPFAAAGHPAVSILGDVVRSALALHSPRDDMRRIEKAALDRAGRLAAQLAWRWAAMHQGAAMGVG
jgi:acetylornithine deacetylase/succinyl-diaminopimelate desuccinylase-like protein